MTAYSSIKQHVSNYSIEVQLFLLLFMFVEDCINNAEVTMKIKVIAGLTVESDSPQLDKGTQRSIHSFSVQPSKARSISVSLV